MVHSGISGAGFPGKWLQVSDLSESIKKSLRTIVTLPWGIACLYGCVSQYSFYFQFPSWPLCPLVLASIDSHSVPYNAYSLGKGLFIVHWRPVHHSIHPQMLCFFSFGIVLWLVQSLFITGYSGLSKNFHLVKCEPFLLCSSISSDIQPSPSRTEETDTDIEQPTSP